MRPACRTYQGFGRHRQRQSKIFRAFKRLLCSKTRTRESRQDFASADGRGGPYRGGRGRARTMICVDETQPDRSLLFYLGP